MSRRKLAMNQRRQRMRIYQETLDLDRFNANETEFVCRFVTTNETWVPYYTPQTNQQSKQ